MINNTPQPTPNVSCNDSKVYPINVDTASAKKINSALGSLASAFVTIPKPENNLIKPTII